MGYVIDEPCVIRCLGGKFISSAVVSSVIVFLNVTPATRSELLDLTLNKRLQTPPTRNAHLKPVTQET